VIPWPSAGSCTEAGIAVVIPWLSAGSCIEAGTAGVSNGTAGIRLAVAKFLAAAPDVDAEASTFVAAALFSAAKAAGETAAFSASEPDFPSKLEDDSSAGIEE